MGDLTVLDIHKPNMPYSDSVSGLAKYPGRGVGSISGLALGDCDSRESRLAYLAKPVVGMTVVIGCGVDFGRGSSRRRSLTGSALDIRKLMSHCASADTCGQRRFLP